VLFAQNGNGAASIVAVEGGAPVAEILATNVSLIANNFGYALFSVDSPARLLLNNVDVSDNTSEYYGAGLPGDIVTYDGADGTAVRITYSNFFNAVNDANAFVGIPSPFGSNGNLSVAPDYWDTTSANALDWNTFPDPGDGINPETASPLIDAGDPSFGDWAGSFGDDARSVIGVHGGPGGFGWGW
jgi:hypothetical protein